MQAINSYKEGDPVEILFEGHEGQEGVVCAQDSAYYTERVVVHIYSTGEYLVFEKPESLRPIPNAFCAGCQEAFHSHVIVYLCPSCDANF